MAEISLEEAGDSFEPESAQFTGDWPHLRLYDALGRD